MCDNPGCVKFETALGIWSKKVCLKCKRELPYNLFAAATETNRKTGRPHRADLHQIWCKSCDKDQKRRYYQERKLRADIDCDRKQSSSTKKLASYWDLVGAEKALGLREDPSLVIIECDEVDPPHYHLVYGE